MLRTAAIFALGVSSALAHTVPGGDIDPNHNHDGVHYGDMPFHLHDPPGPHASGAGSGWTIPDHQLEEVNFDEVFRSLQTVNVMGSFTEQNSLAILNSYLTNIVPLTRVIEEHADANHPRDGTYARGQYDANDPTDPTTIFIRKRFLHHIIGNAPPVPPNPLDNACRLARCASSANHENPDQSQCIVPGGMVGGPIPYGTIECVCNTRIGGNGPWYSEDSTCNTCSEQDDSCVQCALQSFLYRGSCVETCPEYTTAFGSGNFNRRCEDWGCVPNEGHCQTCDPDNTACIQCGNQTYLHDGECVDTCPADTVPQGTGNFNRFCNPAASDGSDQSNLSCVSGNDNCHICDATGGFCIKCNRTFLYQGECIDSCPAGTEAKGASSNFNRRCVEVE